MSKKIRSFKAGNQKKFGAQQQMNKVLAEIKNIKNYRNQNPNKKKGNRNNNRGTSNRQQPFMSKTSGERGMQRMQSKIVTFEEELGVINGSVGFICNQYNLNPGQFNSFPWLSAEAKQWEKYRFKSLRYEYTPQVTEFSANGVGSLVIGFDSDASDPPPNDLIHALNVKPRAYNLPCKKIVLNVPAKSMNLLNDGYFVRPGNLPGQTDIKTYDCGMINISTIDQANTSGCGILCVYYTVEFFIPILEPTVGPPQNNSVSQFASTAGEAAGANNVPATMLMVGVSTNGLNVVNNGGTFTIPAGNFNFDFYATATSSASYLSALKINVLKNGVSAEFPDYANLASLANSLSGNISFWGTSTGTDTYAFQVTDSYGSGTATNQGLLRITAV